MANKVVKKPRRKLKKQVRMTVGGIFMASAIAVAAIPTGSLRGGEVSAATQVDDDGNVTFTHTVLAPYADTTDNKFHNEIYGKKSYTGLGSDFQETTYGKTFYSDGSNIPLCDPDVTGGIPNTTIYSTGDKMIQFAYVDSTGSQASGGGTKTAIILGYDNKGQLAGGILNIPDTVDAYLNFNDNDGSSSGACAVGKSGNFLFYESSISYNGHDTLYYYVDDVQVPDTDEHNSAMYEIFLWDQTANGGAGGWPVVASLTKNEQELTAFRAEKTAAGESEGTLTQTAEDYSTGKKTYLVKPIMKDVYHNFLPCYYNTYSTWIDKTVYYYQTVDFRPSGTPKAGAVKDSKGNLVPQIADSNDGVYGRISSAKVTAIGKQYIVSDGNNGFKIGGNIDETNGKARGIFANNGNITTLNIGENLSSISDYAFYGCTNMKSITFGNGLNTLGNHAFDNCRNMSSVTIPTACNLITVGAYCFKDCQALKTFNLPSTVTTIGDGSFKGCWALESIDLCTTGGVNGSLTNIGVFAFIDCKKLKSIEFPAGFNQTLLTSAFEGCTSLETIKSTNSTFNIVADTTICDYGWAEFLADHESKSDVKDKFYVEAPDTSSLHKTCTDMEVAYKYPGADIYELTKKERGLKSDETGGKAQPTVTYQINSSNVLTNTTFNGNATSLTFPEYIGPYHIEAIGDNAFQDKCTLVEVRIASTINRIGREAFRGCHNLKYVYFDTDSVEIGEYAFMTQDTIAHAAGCTTYSGDDSDWNVKTTDKHIELHAASDMTDGTNHPKVALGFVGPISVDSTPYKYAMSFDGRYNNGDQAYSFIEYYSGFPTMLTVRYNLKDTEAKTGYSELIDFPTAATLGSYATKDYLSDKDKNAAKKAIEDKTANRPLTEDAQVFTDSAKRLTVPTGIDAIMNGRFAELTDGLAEAMDVKLLGIDHIETGYKADGVTPDKTQSDFYDCKNLGNVILSGKEGAMNTKTIDDYAFSTTNIVTGIRGLEIQCPVDSIGKEAFANQPLLEKVVINNSVDSVGDKAFYGDKTLKEVQLTGVTGPMGDEVFAEDPALESFKATNTVTSMGDYAFRNDAALEDVLFASDISGLGVRPWAGCEVLPNVEFGNGTHFVCEDSIVYGLSSGVKTSVVELLESRTRKVEKEELATITTLRPEAFMDTNVKSISLYDSKVIEIPTNTFANTKSMREIILPSAQTATGLIINENAFIGSAVEEITGENNISLIAATATDGILTPKGSTSEANDGKGNAVTNNTNMGNNKYVTIYAPEGSVLNKYATMYKFNAETIKETVYWTVTFRGWDETEGKLVKIGDSLRIEDGKGVDPILVPTPGAKPDYIVDAKNPWLSSNDSSTVNEIWEDTILTANYITPTADYGKNLVQFFYYDENNDPDHNLPILIDHQYVKPGEDATAPLIPTVPGYTFSRWSASYTNVQKDLDIYAIYNVGYTVNFVYVDPTTKQAVDYQTIAVPAGGDATALVREPSIDGYVFDGWVGTPATGDLTNITMDMYATGSFSPKKTSASGIDGVYTVNFYADGTQLFSLSAPEGADLSSVSAPGKPGYKFTGWSPKPDNVTKDMDVSAMYEPDATSGTTGGSGNNGLGTGNVTLTVVNGSGSGTYLAGSQAIIVANDPPAGQEFGSWTITPADTQIASKGLSATVITMPAENVTVTANYVAKTGGGTAGGNGGNGGNTPTGTPGGVHSSGTTVVIDKNGLSNTGVVQATVNGSSDNFTIKVVESSAASEAILKALLAQYGDISKIVYFPMDISLYDASGDKKITDTSGLTVTITLPLPDSMIQYGGNNKVAGVVNNQLDSLSPRFTTINGVDCVTFTCTHFSPYVIYVNTEQITQAGGSVISDDTPKTGDGIQPKWFLAAGLAGVGGFMFLKRDRKKKVIA